MSLDNIRYINPPQAKEPEISKEEQARRATWNGYEHVEEPGEGSKLNGEGGE